MIKTKSNDTFYVQADVDKNNKINAGYKHFFT